MIPGIEVPLFEGGLVASAPTFDGYAYNMYKRLGAWHVRKGFGQVTQLDTSMGNPRNDGAPDAFADAEWGYTGHLGSYVLDTAFGHTQVISLFEARVYTSMTATDPDHTVPTAITLYVVRVYDLTTNTTWEEPLHRHTSDQPDTDSTPMWTHHATYETAEPDRFGDYQYEQFLSVIDDPAGNDAWFTPFRDALLFGAPAIGVWYYSPIAPAPLYRYRQVDNANRNPSGEPYGESSAFKRVRFVNGPHHLAREGGYEYLSGETVQNPDFAFVWEALGRVVYVIGKELFISDVGLPASVMGGNSLLLTIEERITALAEMNGSLYIFTPTHTWHYSPNAGDVLVTDGRLTPLSDTIGCKNVNLAITAQQRLYWVDDNGAYTTPGNLQIQKVSAEVDRFFTDKIDSPMTSFYTSQGHTTLAAPQPHSQYAFDPRGAHLVFYAPLDLLMLVQPGQRMALVMSEHWAVWSWESIVSLTLAPPATPVPRVGTEERIVEPWLASNEDRLILVGGVDEQLVVQDTKAARAWDDLPSKSMYLLEYGRGGALDRSVDINEDDRTVGGWMEYNFTNDNFFRFYINKPFKVPDNWTYQMSPDQLSNPTSPDSERHQDWFFPVTIVPELLGVVDLPLTGFDLHINFNDAHWEPVLRTQSANYSAVATELCLEFPPERIHSVKGYALWVNQGPDAPNGREAQLYDIAGGIPSTTGDQLRISFRGATTLLNRPFINAGEWDAQPGFGFVQHQHNLLFYIVMRRKRAADASEDVNAMVDWEIITSNLFNGGGILATTGSRNIWRQTFFFEEDRAKQAPQIATGSADAGQRRKDNVAAPVDYLWQSPGINAEGGGRVKLRGARMRVRSRGAGTELDSGNQGWDEWGARLLNVQLGSDRKDAVAQLIDYDAEATTSEPGEDAVVSVVNKQGIRSRLWDGAQLVPATFDVAEWGDPAAPATGDVLTAGDEVSETVFSANVRGVEVRLTLFGHMMSKAAQLTLETGHAIIRRLGTIGRKGRNR